MTDKNDTISARGINTRLAHSGHDPASYHGFVNPPVVRASTVLFPDAGTMETRNQKYTYGIRGTPTTEALATAIDALEGSAGTVLVPSGLAAVTLPMLSVLSAGDHALIVDSVYGPTRTFCDTMLRRLGVEVSYYDPRIGADIASLLKDNTRLIHLEAPGSNTFEMQDVPAITAVSSHHGIATTMDNTWATPLFFKPLDHGVDISIHAATKYPAGHADILFGTVSANAAWWPKLLKTHGTLGLCVNGDDAYGVLRGLRTMGIRLERHQESAMALARYLESQPGIARVLHPALETHPDHAIWKRDFCGAAGIFSIVLDGAGGDHARFRRQAHAFLDALRIFGLGYSWGGYESLAVHADLRDRTIATAPEEGPVIRLQIGLEDVVDLKADLDAGLAAANAVPEVA